MYGTVFARTSAPWRIAVGGMPCVMSMTRASGAMRLMTPWHVPTKSSWSPKSVRKETNTRASLRRRERASDGGDQALDVARPASATTARPRARGSGRLRPDRHRRRRVPSAAKARAADGEARTTRSPSASGSGRSSHGAVERDDVRAELVRRAAAGHPPRPRRARDPRPRQLGQQALLRRDLADEVGGAERVRGRAPDRGDPARPAAHPPRSSRAPVALVTTTQS